LVEEPSILIKNASIVDGSGNPYYKADIAIRRGRIDRIARSIKAEGFHRLLQADHLTVTPGFIDTHTHDDFYVIVRPTCDDKVLQGVTTCVIGNCGFSIAPLSPAHKEEAQEAMRVIGSQEIPPEFWESQSFGEYLQRLEVIKVGINLIPLVGHQSTRIAVLGSVNRAPNDWELGRMKGLVTEAMEAGAFGFSTGLIYAPGSYAQLNEIVELTKVVAPYGGIYISHIRSEGDFEIPALEEAIRVGREAGVPVHISHLKVVGRENWGKSKAVLRMISEARAAGIQVTCDQYPYTAGSTYLASALPPWILAGGEKEYSQRLQEKRVRKAIVEEIEKGKESLWENWIKAAGFEGIVITASPRHPDYVGKTVAAIAQAQRKNPYDLIFDLIIEEKKATAVLLFVMAEEDVEKIMQSPFTMIGTDGIPRFGPSQNHPRQTGSFPRVLGRYCREKGILGLEDAVRKMTSLPAQAFQLKKKGWVREGFDADLVVFDPQTIIDRSTYEDPNREPEGINYVLVNGEIAVENGKVTRATSGKILRRQKGWS